MGARCSRAARPALQMNKDQSQYINTMVFCVVAGIISLMLLLLIMNASDLVRNYSAYIITVEIGLVLVIVLAIYRIIAYEQRLRKESINGTSNKLNIDSCPDYWTRYGNKCVNTFDAKPGGPTLFVDGRSDMAAETDDVLVKKIATHINLTSFDNRTISSVCNELRSPTRIPGPWTDVRSVCDSYRLGGITV